ncbi:hypothetical protein BIZ92_08245 [Achromobacter xylosoxidans]|uniref:Methyltransferase domain-containing protein n=1 Tax=Alcaligenes xylosoxydans xylosoxydans TaxID=85698 RepID=A0A1R1JZM9_ALCXX|nr:hypothetical protein BIZ92_08245 [Achromobacter xylosoxidans]
MDSSLRWEHLPKFMQTGTPWIESDRSLHDVEKFYSSFFSDIPYLEQMTPAAEWVADKLGGAPEEILDIGAGAGTWSFAMARKSTARVTGVDLPEVLQRHFLPSADKVGLIDRVVTIAGDFHEISLPRERYDRIVMGSSFHFLHEQRASLFLRRVAAALKENGEFVVIDHFADTTAEQRLSRTLYEMRLAMRTLYAKNYSKQEIEVLCAGNGFTRGRTFDAEGPGFLAVLVFSKA